MENMKNNRYETLVEATEDLAKRGFTVNFSVNKRGELQQGGGKTYAEHEVKLVEFHRFDGMTNPSDDSIIYAVETNTGEKGTVVDAYGADGSEWTSKFMNEIAQEHYDDDEQQQLDK
jgi:hypothetical protein